LRVFASYRLDKDWTKTQAYATLRYGYLNYPKTETGAEDQPTV
jgi:hypothetical protein